MDKARKAVTILGGGTQGSRLAFMWTKRGRPVYLIDQNEQQLVRAKKWIESSRAQTQPQTSTPSSPSSSQYGEVITATPKSLSDAASKSWLLLEVRTRTKHTPLHSPRGRFRE